MAAPKPVRKNAQTLKPTTKKTHTPITLSSDYEDYFDMCIWKRTPINIEGIERKAEVLVKWALTYPQAYTLKQWLNENGIDGGTLKRWKERSPVFATAYNFAREIVGTKREIGALTKKLSESMVMGSMPIYSDDWRELAEWKNDLAIKAKVAGAVAAREATIQQEAPKVVIIERYGPMEQEKIEVSKKS
jgi:hypothetical protein